MPDEFRVVSPGQSLQIERSLTTFDKTLDTDRLNALQAIEALPDVQREALLQDFGVGSLDELDEQLEEETGALLDRLDWYDYLTKSVSYDAVEGDWFSPIEIQSVCGEAGGNVAANAIDGNDATFWRHNLDHQHVIIFKLRDYPKKITKIRFRYDTSEPAEERLNDMDVHAARAIPKIDTPKNILETGINIAWPTGAGTTWVEHTLAKAKPEARFVKLVINGTDHINNRAQIREFEVWVEPMRGRGV